jgi:hypothetical protein
MSEYFSVKLEIPFREVNKEQKKADLFVHSLNYGGPGGGEAEIGDSSYYDCNHFRNAWYSKTNRNVSGYHNSSVYQGEFKDKELKELRRIAFLRGREIAKKIISQWSLEDETLVIVLPPNSLLERRDSDKIVEKASNHIGSWIGFGVNAFLELEGHEVVSIRHDEFSTIRQDHVQKINTPFRLVLIDDTILKGRTLYPWIKLALEFLITLNSARFPIDNYRIDVCTFFTRSDGINFLKHKNGWTRYGLSTRSVSEDRVICPRVSDENYARVLWQNVNNEDWTRNEEELILQFYED